MFSGLGYAIVEGFRNVSRNTKSSFISIITMIFTMFVFGGFFAIGQNVNSFLVQVQEKEGIEVFIYDETTEQQKNEFETSVKALDGVNSVTFKSKNDALEDFKSRIAKESDNASEILEGYSGDNNIFPASYIVRLTDLEKATAVEEEIARIGARIATENRTETEAELQTENSTQKDTIVKRILSKNQVIDVMVKLVRGARIALGIIFLILLVFSVTIISNTIKLSLHARRREMSIMKYVGATNGFVRGPYVIEGMILGIISSVISLLLIGSMYDAIIKQIESSNVLKQIGISLLTFLDIANGLIIVYLFLGIGIGIIGSAVSMKKYLEV
ncbi:MAG: ABC transporter permease [Clostridia bacterium]|nr:ABC transporter permease [Clostridia bacterium]